MLQRLQGGGIWGRWGGCGAATPSAFLEGSAKQRPAGALNRNKQGWGGSPVRCAFLSGRPHRALPAVESGAARHSRPPCRYELCCKVQGCAVRRLPSRFAVSENRVLKDVVMCLYAVRCGQVPKGEQNGRLTDTSPDITSIWRRAPAGRRAVLVVLTCVFPHPPPTAPSTFLQALHHKLTQPQQHLLYTAPCWPPSRLR